MVWHKAWFGAIKDVDSGVRWYSYGLTERMGQWSSTGFCLWIWFILFEKAGKALDVISYTYQKQTYLISHQSSSLLTLLLV